ncbi:MAG: carboxypeptidase-like regulatory domain-containing protein, partial [Flavitalea sp.]
MKHEKSNNMLRMLLWTCFYVFLFSSTAIAQSRKISGKITSKENAALSGATVSVKGTQRSTSTDESGNFMIDATTGDVLTVSYIGYLSQDITV